MKNKQVKRPLTLLDLNEDCLHLIFEKLTMSEQFIVWEISQRFADIILSIWIQKYASGINFIKDDEELRVLTRKQITQLIGRVSTKTHKFLNVDKRVISKFFDCCRQFKFRKLHTLSFFGNSTKFMLRIPRNMKAMLPMLTTLRLCKIQLDVQQLLYFDKLNTLELIFVKLKNTLTMPEVLEHLAHTLQHLTYLPHYNQLVKAEMWHDIGNCHALHTLKVRADLLPGLKHEVLALPNLQQLTVFCTHIASDHHKVLAMLNDNALVDVVGVTVNCHFDSDMVRELRGMRKMHRFEWQSPPLLDWSYYQPRWRMHDPDITPAIIELLQGYKELEQLDLRNNYVFQDGIDRMDSLRMLQSIQKERGKCLRILLDTQQPMRGQQHSIADLERFEDYLEFMIAKKGI